MKRALAFVGGLLVVACVALFGFYLSRNPEKRSLDDAARRDAPGRFVRLSDGVTHYELLGPETGTTVVLVHGFSVPYYIWDSTTASLASKGFRVLRYDEYGRGWSDRPSGTYDADMYDRQVKELLDSLHIAGPVHLAGVSMGGWVTGTFAGRHPDRVRSLILVDPVAGKSGGPPSGFRIPAVGSIAWQTFVVPTMADGQMSDFVHPDRFPDWKDRYRQQMQFKGFGGALLSTLKSRTGVAMDSVYHTVAAANVPVLLIWGEKDNTVPFANNASVRAAIPNAEFHPINDAGHLPILERAAYTDSIILAWLEKQPKAR
jgi:pimeloyl-ACP methyl ester carboxylesterase